MSTTYYVDKRQIPFTFACLMTAVGIVFSTAHTLYPANQPEPRRMLTVEDVYREPLPVMTQDAVIAAPIKFDGRIDGARDSRADIIHRMNVNRFYLAATMWGEARAEGRRGMLAVGNVMLNRIANDPGRYGASIKQAALRRKQFSCWNSNDPNHSLLTVGHLRSLSPTSQDGKAWHDAVRIADALLAGQATDNTNGATHYHAKSILPYWASTIAQLRAIGSHVFYRG